MQPSGPENEKKKSVDVGGADLPLHCPLPSQALWNKHPRVYLPIEATKEARCPYCGTLYRLTGEVASGH
jgi:uncharacterized Zn-finger protein